MDSRKKIEAFDSIVESAKTMTSVENGVGVYECTNYQMKEKSVFHLIDGEQDGFFVIVLGLFKESKQKIFVNPIDDEEIQSCEWKQNGKTRSIHENNPSDRNHLSQATIQTKVRANI